MGRPVGFPGAVLVVVVVVVVMLLELLEELWLVGEGRSEDGLELSWWLLCETSIDGSLRRREEDREGRRDMSKTMRWPCGFVLVNDSLKTEESFFFKFF